MRKGEDGERNNGVDQKRGKIGFGFDAANQQRNPGQENFLYSCLTGSVNTLFCLRKKSCAHGMISVTDLREQSAFLPKLSAVKRKEKEWSVTLWSHARDLPTLMPLMFFEWHSLFLHVRLVLRFHFHAAN